MSVVMKVIGIAGHEDVAAVFSEGGVWLKNFDPDACDGRGWADLTHNKAEAMRFVDFAAAMMAWKAQSKKRPLRPDGKPNRPLTAYTVEIEPHERK